jgi:hypothetical protein
MPETRIAGKRGRKPSPPTPELRLALFAPAPSTPPPTGDVTGGIVDWGMLGNDTYGDCGPAATEHYRMAKAGSVTVSPAATDAYTENLYFEYGKAQGEPGEQPDQGVDNLTWLTWLFDNGYIEGFARLDPSKPDEIRQAMINFNGVIIGCSLTDDAEAEFEATPPQPWNITPKDLPDPNEGHDILLVAYDADSWTLVTWAALQRALITWETGEEGAGDLECWVIITAEDAARNGVDITALKAAITALGGQVAPDAPTPTPPVPVPVPVPAPTDLQAACDALMKSDHGAAEVRAWIEIATPLILGNGQ